MGLAELEGKDRGLCAALSVIVLHYVDSSRLLVGRCRLCSVFWDPGKFWYICKTPLTEQCLTFPMSDIPATEHEVRHCLQRRLQPDNVLSHMDLLPIFTTHVPKRHANFVPSPFTKRKLSTAFRCIILYKPIFWKKKSVSLYVIPCGSCWNQRFGGRYRLRQFRSSYYRVTTIKRPDFIIEYLQWNFLISFMF